MSSNTLASLGVSMMSSSEISPEAILHSPSLGAFPRLSSWLAVGTPLCCLLASAAVPHLHRQSSPLAHSYFHNANFSNYRPVAISQSTPSLRLVIGLWMSAEFFLTVHNNSNSLTSTMRQLTFLKFSASGCTSERFPLQSRQLPLLNNLSLSNLILVPK